MKPPGLSLKQLLVWLVALRTAAALDLSFEDLEGANKTCGEKDKCERGPGRNGSRLENDLDWRERNCLCDELCATYGDCCIDSPRFELAQQRRGTASFACVKLKQYGGIYMRNSCPPQWSDQRTRLWCETKAEDYTDPMAGLPVTGRHSRITYRNVFCARCHGERVDLDFWTPRLECASLNTSQDLTQEDTSRLLHLNKTEDGLAVWGISVEGKFRICEVDPYLPETLIHIVRRCQADTIKTCAVNWTNTKIRNSCEAYTSMVYQNSDSYRNPHCAICNNVPLHLLTCSKTTTFRFSSNFEFTPGAFNVLFQFRGSRYVGKVQPCNDTQLYDPFFKRCRDLLVDVVEGFQEYNVTSNLTALKSPHSTRKVVYEFVPLEKPQNWLSCRKFVLGKGDYEDRNGSAHVPIYRRTFVEGEYMIREDGQLEVCATAVGIKLVDRYGSYMGYITFIGLSVSIIFLLLHLAAFFLVSELRNLSGKNLLSLCLALLAGYSMFMAGQLTEGVACRAIAVITYYSFLAVFFWMLTIAFDVWRTLRLATSELRVSAGKQWRKFAIYSLWSWLAPAIVVTAAILMETAPGQSVPREWRPQFGVHSCWFGPSKSLFVFFVAPAAFILAINLGFFASAAYMVYSTTSTTRYTTSSVTRRDFRLYVRLALLMGLTWTAGLVAGALDVEVLWCAFIALNTLQGLYIFLAFTCTDKVVRGLAGRRVENKPLRPPSFSWSSDSTTHKSHIGSDHTADTLY